MHKFLLSCSGDYLPSAEHDKIIKSCDKVIAVDGGIRHLVSLGMVPDLWVGDMDSSEQFGISQSSFKGQWAEIKREVLNPKKDLSDTEYAIERAKQSGAKSVVMIGAIGSRIDHGLFNINLLIKQALMDFSCTILDGKQKILPLIGSEDAEKHGIEHDFSRLIIDNSMGATMSVVPYSELRGLSLEGFEYPLSDVNLPKYSGLTLSNLVSSSRALASLKSGIAVLVFGKGD